MYILTYVYVYDINCFIQMEVEDLQKKLNQARTTQVDLEVNVPYFFPHINVYINYCKMSCLILTTQSLLPTLHLATAFFY